jgi:arylsulfatase A-like enzyme
MKSNWLLHPSPLKVQLVLTTLAVYLHTFSEWIFFVTKQSFISQSAAADKLRILLLSPLPLVLAGAALVLLYHLSLLLVRDKAWRRRLAAGGIVIPAVILAGTAFLLIDNFTYTIFRRGVITATGHTRWIYVLLLLALVLIAIRILGKKESFPARNPAFRTLAVLGTGLLIISLVAALFRPDVFTAVSLKGESGRLDGNRRPNILLMAGDGINATHMSLYGYSRDTTPYLRTLAGKGLLCENSFTNAGSSGASISSMFTGRLPTRLRLIYPPDILRGADAYRHLPGILRQQGYRNFDISVRHFADPYDLNMRKAFDWANYREIKEGILSETICRNLGLEPDYFLRIMSERISERLLHISGYRRMVDSYGEVMVESRKHKTKAEGINEMQAVIGNNDNVRIEAFFSFIDESPQPFFAHLHLLGTHGPYFYPKRRVFSRDKKQPDKWMTDFYDDAILNFDLLVRRVLRGLQERGMRENTLIVVLTDHGSQWSIDNRIPLLFLFPDGEHSGRINGNTQILDIAPTLLDYLGIIPPDWMEGSSLLAGEVESGRFIFTVDRKMGDTRKKTSGGYWIMDAKKTGPPFYSLGSLGIFSRQKLFNLVLEDSHLEISTVKGHTFPAAPAEIPAPEVIEQLLVDHLAESGYDISSLKRPFTIEHLAPKSEARDIPAAGPRDRKARKDLRDRREKSSSKRIEVQKSR